VSVENADDVVDRGDVAQRSRSLAVAARILFTIALARVTRAWAAETLFVG